MSDLLDAFASARRVADAVLYEGYLLYPYRSSAQKNRVRWQFGVLAPQAWSEGGGGDPWSSRTETLLEADDDAVVHIRLRALQLETTATGWDEGVEQELDALVGLGDARAGEQEVAFRFDGGSYRAGGPVPEGCPAPPGADVRVRHPVTGRLRIRAERLPGPYGVVRLRVDVDNTGACPPGLPREAAMRRSLVSTHLLMGATGGTWLSLTDPPEWAAPAAASCVNRHTWPVLLGGDGMPAVVLSSPIILPDQAEVAPESQGDLFDATEIDEILSLRTLALTDDEKAEARATDRRAAAIVDRTEQMPAEVWERLHGAVRSLRPVTAAPEPPSAPDAPWWDPGADPAVDPDTDSVTVAGRSVAKGSPVRLRPGRADAQDMFLAGRVARVEAVVHDVDGNTHLAVRLEDDPASELMVSHGRFFYFHPDEVEPL